MQLGRSSQRWIGTDWAHWGLFKPSWNEWKWVIKPWSLKCQILLASGSCQREPICCGISGRTCLLKQAQTSAVGKNSDWVKLREDELCTGAFLCCLSLFPCYCYWAHGGINQKVSPNSRREFWFQFSHLKGSWGTAIRTLPLLALFAWPSAPPLLAVLAVKMTGISMPRKQTLLYLWDTFVGITCNTTKLCYLYVDIANVFQSGTRFWG